MATESQSLETMSAPRSFINQLAEHVGQNVTIKGWLYNLRSSGKLLFPQLRDGTGIAQCVYFRGECSDKSFEDFEKLKKRIQFVIKH